MFWRPSASRTYSTKSVESARRTSPVRWSSVLSPDEPGTKWTRSSPRSACGLPSRSYSVNDRGAEAIARSTTSRGNRTRPSARGRQAGLDESPAHLGSADLHADLGQHALRLVDDAVDELGREEVEAGATHRESLLPYATGVTDRPRRAADLLVDCLAAEGCEYVFSVPGEETMDILDALSRHEGVRHITTRHEQGAAFMADVHGRLTGRAAVAMATLGPGRHEPRHRHRRRLPRPGADGRDHRPGRVGQAPQGGPPGRRHRPDVRAGHEVEHPGRADRGDPGDRAQGVPGRDAREARARPTSSCPRTSPRRAIEPRDDGGPVPLDARHGPTSPSRPTRRSPTPPASSRAPSGRSSSPATACCAAAPRRSCAPSRAASTSRSRRRSWARARSTTARTCR